MYLREKIFRDEYFGQKESFFLHNIVIYNNLFNSSWRNGDLVDLKKMNHLTREERSASRKLRGPKWLTYYLHYYYHGQLFKIQTVHGHDMNTRLHLNMCQRKGRRGMRFFLFLSLAGLIFLEVKCIATSYDLHEARSRSREFHWGTNYELTDRARKSTLLT